MNNADNKLLYILGISTPYTDITIQTMHYHTQIWYFLLEPCSCLNSRKFMVSAENVACL